MNIIDEAFEKSFKDAYGSFDMPCGYKQELRQMFFVGSAFTLGTFGNKSDQEVSELVQRFREGLIEFSKETIPELDGVPLPPQEESIKAPGEATAVV